jgi:hypothetical protein
MIGTLNIIVGHMADHGDIKALREWMLRLICKEEIKPDEMTFYAILKSQIRKGKSPQEIRDNVAYILTDDNGILYIMYFILYTNILL